MQRRRVMLAAGKKPRLPSEYQEVEYLESTPLKSSELPYIDTSILMSADLKFEIDFQISENIVVQHYLMGTYDETSFFLYLSRLYGKTYFFQTAFGSDWDNTNLVANNNRHTFVYQFVNGYLIVTDSESQILKVPMSTMSSRTIIVAGATQKPHLSCKTFASRMTKNGVLIQNLVPCYRKSDHKPGMYDLVTKTFFINQGTGEFLVGADVN